VLSQQMICSRQLIAIAAAGCRLHQSDLSVTAKIQGKKGSAIIVFARGAQAAAAATAALKA
jgi:hypothetical protein